MNLPEDILAEIISRTLVMTIVYCKRVCNRWCNILSEPYFTKLHLSRSSEVLIFHLGEDDEEYGDLALVELDDERDQHHIHHDPLMRLSVGLDFVDYVALSGSVNGLIFLEDNYDDLSYVCNPITQEYKLLHHSEYTREPYLNGYYGFGFVKSNNQYKIVRLYKGSFPSTEYNLGSEVYTLGTGMWRDIGHVPFHLNGYNRSVYVSGNLDWLADEVICAFYLDEEPFHLMEAPLLASEHTIRNLGVLKGCLCICDITPNYELAIWPMGDYGWEDGSSKELVITFTPLT